jgi:hypothetical protein
MIGISWSKEMRIALNTGAEALLKKKRQEQKKQNNYRQRHTP